jgi:microcystin-dependent protein
MAKYFIYPFAQSGDKTPIPEVSVGNPVSYQDGWGPNYELDLISDPNALPIPRDQTNQLYYDITDAIRQYQTHGVPDFITSADNLGSPFAYDIYAQVRYNDGSGMKIYENRVAGNVTTPPDPSWVVVSGNPVPPGVILPYGGGVVPAGYLLCNGALVLRSTYFALYTAIGDVWGPNNGSSNFALPNLTRRTLVGVGGSAYPGVLGNTLGSVGGFDAWALTGGQMPLHTHEQTPGLRYNPVGQGGSYVGFKSPAGGQQTGPAGNNEAHPNIQQSAVCNFMIKV